MVAYEDGVLLNGWQDGGSPGVDYACPAIVNTGSYPLFSYSPPIHFFFFDLFTIILLVLVEQ